MYSNRQIREIFHFCFLERLLKSSDINLYILKGGVNLRFFFNSPRYSEGMDLDVIAGNVATLKKNGYKILDDGAFKRGLRTYGITDVIVNDPAKTKHTETTQRFGVQLLTASGEQLPSKVEFSRRARLRDDVVLDPIDPELARRYRKFSYRCQYYPGEVAVVQKIKALAGRTITQARDVFDLEILRLGGFSQAIVIKQAVTDEVREAAQKSLLSMSYDDFAGQVLEFIGDDDKKSFASRTAWKAMADHVFQLLEQR